MNDKDMIVRVECDCKCAMVQFRRIEWDDGDVDYDISVLDSRYDHNVNGLFGRLRRAFGVLVGKPVYYNDVMMSPERFGELVDRLQEMRMGA